MKKEIKDYLPYYIGQGIATAEERYNSPGLKLIGICDMGCQLMDEAIKLTYYSIPENCKLLLRPLSSMTEDEKKKVGELGFGGKTAGSLYFQTFTPPSFNYLLKKGFDLFGLLEAGLAIDATTLNN